MMFVFYVMHAPYSSDPPPEESIPNSLLPAKRMKTLQTLAQACNRPIGLRNRNLMIYYKTLQISDGFPRHGVRI